MTNGTTVAAASDLFHHGGGHGHGRSIAQCGVGWSGYVCRGALDGRLDRCVVGLAQHVVYKAAGLLVVVVAGFVGSGNEPVFDA